MAQVIRLNELLNDKLEYLWKSSGAWPEYQQVMRLAFKNTFSDSIAHGQGSSHLSGLPGLCCQAAGGNPGWASDLALAWLLAYSAAQLMDSVKDNDEPDAWWVNKGVGVALSAATGLYFSASLALNAALHHPATQECAAEIAGDFFKTFLVMGSGQYADLTSPSITLPEYWRQAETKSGAFFSLACRAGARLATQEIGTISEYSRFGSHLGLVIQISDDLDDVRPPQGSGSAGQKKPFARSLPAVFALDVLPHQKAEELRGYLQAAEHSTEAAHAAVSLIDQCGAADYVLIEMERHKGEALKALERANPLPPAGVALAKILQEI